jgi:hypothetical protein
MTAVDLKVLLLSTVSQPQRLDVAHTVGRELRIVVVICIGSE